MRRRAAPHTTLRGGQCDAHPLEGTRRNAAWGLGALRPDLPDSAPLVRKRDPQSAQPGFVTRTAAEILYEAEPSFVLCDFDTKGMPPDVKSRLQELGGICATLRASESCLF